MTRHTSFSFTLRPTAAQEQVLWRHAGAARFAYNQSLALVNEALAAKKRGADVRVPWSGFDLINAFNRWKRSADAGVHEDGSVGLPWRTEITQQVFEEAAVDLGRGFANFSARRTAGSRAAGFPKYKKRSDANQSFRIRNRARGNSSSIRVGGEGRERSIELPKLGLLLVRECTRRMRRMLKKGRLKILFATISHRSAGHWKVTINVEAALRHPALCHPSDGARVAVGIDRGLQTFGHLVLEKLNTAGMMRTRLARSLADSAWAMFARMLQYKQEWRGGTLLLADRFYPSTRRCSACATVGEALPLSERTFHCSSCGHKADRDTNAAVCLAQYPQSSWSHVAAKQAETLNVCREESAGAWPAPRVELASVKQKERLLGAREGRCR